MLPVSMQQPVRGRHPTAGRLTIGLHAARTQLATMEAARVDHFRLRTRPRHTWAILYLSATRRPTYLLGIAKNERVNADARAVDDHLASRIPLTLSGIPSQGSSCALTFFARFDRVGRGREPQLHRGRAGQGQYNHVALVSALVTVLVGPSADSVGRAFILVQLFCVTLQASLVEAMENRSFRALILRNGGCTSSLCLPREGTRCRILWARSQSE